MALHVGVLNYALEGLSPERMRLHLCWGNYEGPHHYDIPLREILPLVLKARPAAISFNFIEHPELVAERLVRYAEVVGRERVIAGTDCGFGTSAWGRKVDAKIAWAKLQSLVEGARLASVALW